MPQFFLFKRPDIGEGVAEAEIICWRVKIGDIVEEDQPLVDVMTDKATVEMTSPISGRVVALHGEIGERAPVGSPLVEFEVKETAVKETHGSSSAPAASSPLADPTEPARPATPPISTDSGAPHHASALRNRPLAAPAVRRRAAERGVQLQSITGTGPGDRITAEDLDRHAEDDGSAELRRDLAHRTRVTEIPITGLRRRIAEHMELATRRIPHFSYVEEFDLSEIEALRRELNAERVGDAPRLTLLPFFMRALVHVIPEFPQVNGWYDEDAGVMRSHEAIHVGIATQTPGGLMVPVVRHVEARDLWDCARELTRVTTATRESRAASEELSGSTITLTSLGALGGIAATPVINAPEVAILGPNRLAQRPVVMDGQLVIRTMMNLSSSFDHRIVDGYDAARFVQRLKRLIERPALLFVDRR